MQHDHVLKKMTCNILTPSPGIAVRGIGESVGKIFCYHVAAFVIPFNSDMQHDHVLKKLSLVTF